ncbi:MAG: hypothetical protein ACO1SV_01815 [Fimbriimonas sp.]
MIATLVAASLAVGPYKLVRSDDRWLFQGPSGKPFWSLATCCTGPGTAWESDDPGNPSYRGFKLFPNAKAWMDGTLPLLKENGFNSLGGWSDTALFAKYGGANRLPYYEVLHLGAYDKAPWRDMFSKGHAQIIDKAARDQIERTKDDPYLVGYFSDNELGWWREALFLAYLKMEPKEPGRQRFVRFLRDRYRNDFRAFGRDWATKAKGFEGVGGEIKLQRGSRGMEAVRDWQSVLTAHYYRQMRDAIRRYDPNRLILGDRYCQFYYPNVVKTATPFVDAISTNYGADWTTGENTEYFLSALHRITKKPVLVTEFYMAAMENRSGNKNSSGGFPVVQTQAERASAVRTYLQDLGRRPYVVGAHWFQFFDEPTNGRGDGENYNMGLVDIHGKPYEGLADVFKSFRLPPPSEPSFKGSLPSAPSAPERGLREWPGKREMLIAPGAEAPFGDLYACADPEYLYFGLASMGFTDESLYPGGRVPEEDRSRLAVTVNGRKHEVRFGGKGRECATDADSKTIYWRDGVRSELILRVPRPAGSELRIEAELTTHGRADRMTWRDRRPLP